MSLCLAKAGKAIFGPVNVLDIINLRLYHGFFYMEIAPLGTWIRLSGEGSGQLDFWPRGVGNQGSVEGPVVPMLFSAYNGGPWWPGSGWIGAVDTKIGKIDAVWWTPHSTIIWGIWADTQEPWRRIGVVQVVFWSVVGLDGQGRCQCGLREFSSFWFYGVWHGRFEMRGES